MKKLMVILLALCTVVSLTACSQGGGISSTGGSSLSSTGESSSSPESVSTEQTVLRFWQAGADTADATNIMSELLTQFMKENPGIIVEYQAYPWANEPHTAFQTAIAGGDVADLLIVGSPFDFVLAESGQILPLDEYIDDDVKEDLMGVFANECIYYGENADLTDKYISMPLFGDARTILYNKEIFDAAGVDYPDKSWTHEELIEAARKLTGTINGKQVYGFTTSANYASQYMTFIWNYGGNVLNEANTAAITDGEEWRKGIENYMTFFNENLTPPGSEAMSLADQLTMFMNDEVAMMVATSDYAKEIQNSEDFGSEKLGVGIMPHEDYQTAFAGADVFVIPAQSQHPQEAGKLINFLLQTENQLKYAKTVGFFPSVQSAANDSYYTGDPTRAAFADAVNHGRFYVKTAFSAGVTPILRANIQELIAGNIDMDRYIENITGEINALIAEQ